MELDLEASLSDSNQFTKQVGMGQFVLTFKGWNGVQLSSISG